MSYSPVMRLMIALAVWLVVTPASGQEQAPAALTKALQEAEGPAARVQVYRQLARHYASAAERVPAGPGAAARRVALLGIAEAQLSAALIELDRVEPRPAGQVFDVERERYRVRLSAARSTPIGSERKRRYDHVLRDLEFDLSRRGRDPVARLELKLLLGQGQTDQACADPQLQDHARREYILEAFCRDLRQVRDDARASRAQRLRAVRLIAEAFQRLQLPRRACSEAVKAAQHPSIRPLRERETADGQLLLLIAELRWEAGDRDRAWAEACALMAGPQRDGARLLLARWGKRPCARRDAMAGVLLLLEDDERDANRCEELIAELDHPRGVRRERALRQLTRIASHHEARLEQVSASASTSVEVRLQLRRALDTLPLWRSADALRLAATTTPELRRRLLRAVAGDSGLERSLRARARAALAATR